MKQDPNLLLLDAAARGDAETVKRCIEQGADPDARDAHTGWTALHLAAAGGHGQAVQALVERYADREARTPNGSTPLQLAFDHHRWHVIFQLMALGACNWGLDLECRQWLIEALASVGPRLT
jgi:ankyrin repeat protein